MTSVMVIMCHENHLPTKLSSCNAYSYSQALPHSVGYDVEEGEQRPSKVDYFHAMPISIRLKSKMFFLQIATYCYKSDASLLGGVKT